MTTTTIRQTTYDPDADAIDIRDAVGERGGFFAVSLPVSSDSRARDGEAFDTDRLRGFAEQINSDRTIPVFLSHGRGPLADERYGAVGKIGRVTDAALETRDGATLLTADLEIADPDDLAEAGDTGDVEATLRWVRQQFRLGLGAVSVGWQEEIGDREVPGDAELLEVSVVGIESDTEAQQAGAEPSAAAVRGFEALPTPSPTDQERDPLGWTETTDADRAQDALDTLAAYYEDRQGRDRGAPHLPEAPAAVADPVADLLQQFGHGKRSVTTRERLATLRGEGREAREQREDALDRLEAIAKHRDEETRPGADAWNDDVLRAVRKLRELLTGEDGAEPSAPAWRA